MDSEVTGPDSAATAALVEPDRESNVPRSSTGVVMKNRADHPFGLGFVLILLVGSLWAQVPAPKQADGRPPAPAAAASLTQPLTPSANKPHDDSFVIGNDDLLAINVWKIG